MTAPPCCPETEGISPRAVTRERLRGRSCPGTEVRRQVRRSGRNRRFRRWQQGYRGPSDGTGAKVPPAGGQRPQGQQRDLEWSPPPVFRYGFDGDRRPAARCIRQSPPVVRAERSWVPQHPPRGRFRALTSSRHQPGGPACKLLPDRVSATRSAALSSSAPGHARTRPWHRLRPRAVLRSRWLASHLSSWRRVKGAIQFTIKDCASIEPFSLCVVGISRCRPRLQVSREVPALREVDS